MLILKVAAGIVLAFVVIEVAQVCLALAVVGGLNKSGDLTGTTVRAGAPVGLIGTDRPTTLRPTVAVTPTPARSEISFTSVRTPVSRGGTALVTITASPNTTCSITVTYLSGPSTAQGLEPKTTDGRGAATWSWTVGTNTTRGSWPIEVRCGGMSGRTTFVVQ